jgi:PAS domain S-box-containing protein
MAITSPTKGCLEVNEQLCRLLGYTREELLQKDWAELTHPDNLAADVAQFNRVMAGEIDGYTLDKRFIRKGGQFIDVTISVNCMRRADGSCDSFLALVQDVTERTQAQEALRVAKGRLDSAMRGSNIGIWEVDMPDGNFQTGRVRHINFWEYLGYSAAEIALDVPTSLDFAHPDDRQHTQDAFDAYLCGKTPDLEVENRGRHKNGCYRWFLTRGVAIRDATGKPIRLTGTVQDITERKRQALRQRAIADAALKINASLSVEQPLNATMQLLIDEARQIIGAHVAIAGVIPIQEPRQSVALFSLSEEYRQRQGDFASKQDPFSLSEGLLVPLLGRDGQKLGAFQLAHKFEGDFTAEDEAVAVQLAAMASVAIENWTLYQQIKEVDRHKDIFLAHVSHEIRTPMNAILGMADLTLQTPLSEIQRTYLTTVKSSSEALINVINDLLDFSKIRAGKLRLDPAEFSLRKLLNEVLRTLAVAAHEKKLELICDVNPQTPDALIGDAGRLRQVLLNLVGNAIKFTQEGQVVVLVGVGEDRDGIQTKPPHEELTPGVQLSVQVRDTGIGIPAERQKGIFNAFEQGDRTTSRRFGGTGLGLSIASRLVALMDGNLTVSSNVGQGSTFKFTVGLALRQDSRPPVAADLGGLKVLIVDDNAMQRQILEQWLRNWKAEPQSIGDGLTASQAMIRAASEGHPFSLVLLDADMPGIDGVALATRISKVPELANCRIILTTREAKPDLAVRHSMPVGATLTTKPLLPDELLETICRVLAALGEGVTKEKLAAGGSAADDKLAVDLSFKAATESLSILLAEDNVFNQEVIRHLLERKGHTVMTVSDGRQALDALDQKPFDLLLLDCQMPEMDGFQVVEDLRRREHDTSAHLPVVGLTALSMKGDRERCLNAGMDAYLSKPIRAAEFYEAINQVVRKNSSPSNIDREIPVPEPIDAPTLLAACGGNSELLKKMINSFNVHARKQLQVIGKAIEAVDPQAMGRSAHKLIGLLSAFSPSGAEALRVLEDMGGAGQINGADEQQAGITQIVDSLATALDTVTIEQLRAQCNV